MVLDIKGTTLMGKNMVMENFYGLTGLIMMENSLIMIFRAEGFISGLMEESMKGSGSAIRWMEKAFLGGKTEGCIKELM